jgi:hypothetical protein
MSYSSINTLPSYAYAFECVGMAVCSLQPADNGTVGEASERKKQLWAVLKDKQVLNLSLCEN